jgi:hypothetical protein
LRHQLESIVYIVSINIFLETDILKTKNYDKQDKQGKAAFSERSPHTIQQQEPTARSHNFRPGQRAEYGQDNHLNKT